MLDDFGHRIRDIILSEMDLSRELSDEEICDLIGSVVSREARDRPMTIKDRAELERTLSAPYSTLFVSLMCCRSWWMTGM